MKTILLLALVTLTGITGASAAGVPHSPAVYIGPSYSWFDYDGAMSVWTADNAVFSGTIGVSKLIDVAHPVSLDTGLRWARVGSQVEYKTSFTDPAAFASVTVEGEFEYAFDYIALPLLARVQQYDGYGLFVFLGPEIQLLLRAKSPCEDDADGITCPDDADLIDDLHRWNTTLVTGLGYQKDVGPRSLEFQIRYGLGQDGVAKGDWLMDWRTRELNSTIGVRF